MSLTHRVRPKLKAGARGALSGVSQKFKSGGRVGSCVKQRSDEMKNGLVFCIVVAVLSALAFSPTGSSAGPVSVNCKEGEKKCEGSYEIAASGTKQFIGRCAKRPVECLPGNYWSITPPAAMYCESAGSKNVTCTHTGPVTCLATRLTCSCTNWALQKNRAVAKVYC